MKNGFFLMLFCTLSVGAFAQTFTISNKSNGQEKTFKPGGYYEIYLAENMEAFKDNCCDYATLKGSLATVSEDSFQINLTRYERRVIADNMEVIHEHYAKEASNYGHFSKNDIFAIQYFKSEKSQKRKVVFFGLGAAFLSTGIITALNTFTVSDSDSKKTLWKSAGVQAGAGLVLMIANGPKKYVVKGKDTFWQLK